MVGFRMELRVATGGVVDSHGGCRGVAVVFVGWSSDEEGGVIVVAVDAAGVDRVCGDRREVGGWWPEFLR
ncbi:hypothetical protein Tco_1038969 [Tanacetum coccineum]